MIFLRVHVLSLLVGGVWSLNHKSFLGEGDFDARTIDAETREEIGDFFDLFSPLPPVPPPPSESPTSAPVPPSESPTESPTTESPTGAPVPPTEEPTEEPTLSPVITPTRPPIPAGRFISPVVPPTERPVAAPTTKPIRVNAPIREGRFPDPPSPAPTRGRRRPPTFVPQNLQPDVDTMVTFYNAEWGSEVNECFHEFPNVYFHCHEGGVLKIKDSKNAKCSVIADDRAKCTQEDADVDASIEFSCSGIKKAHLMSTATVGPDLVTNCANMGKLVNYLTLDRQCDGFSDVTTTCNDGAMPWEQDGVFYCASPTVCQSERCNGIKLGPIFMTNMNDDLKCSRVDGLQDLQSYTFDSSLLSSKSIIDWRISGQQRGCLWESPALLIKCENGGKLEFAEEYDFCSIDPEDHTGTCESFAPFSAETEETIELSVICTGKLENQLNLKAEIKFENVNVECQSNGTIIQSVMLSRECGENGLVNHPSFCGEKDQVFTVDDEHSHCFVGNTCLTDSGCGFLELPHLIARTASLPIGQCTFVA